jgi:hypothetical protein
LKFELAPPQKSSKIVDESLTLPLHTSKTLDGLHKLLPLLLHTKRKPNDQKKPNRALYPVARASQAIFAGFWHFFAEFFKKTRFFDCLKNCAFFKVKIAGPKKVRFCRFLAFNRRFLLLGI